MKTALDKGTEPAEARDEESARPGRTRAESGGSEREGGRASRRMVALGIAALAVLTVLQMYSTWATWGNLSIDAGHETYVPWVLSEGQMLYRDVWYHYGPAGVYFNSWLFTIFGRHLAVLYLAGGISALVSAIFLFLTGSELRYPWPGWVAGAVVVLEAFHEGLFCFPLPYSFPAVYGCVIACALLWLLVRGLQSGGWMWMTTAGLLAAAALVTKLEFGVMCYAALGLAATLRLVAKKNWKRFAKDLAALLPGLAICAAVIRWMVSIHGLSFITQENILSWPTSFFMRTYGKAWLAHTGLAFSGEALLTALQQTVLVAGALLAVRLLLSEKKKSLRGNLLVILLVLGLVAYCKLLLWELSLTWVVQTVFFPKAMVLYTAAGAAIAAWYWLREPEKNGAAQLALLLGFSSLLAFRLLFSMSPEGYPIYYNGPATLGYLILLMIALGGRDGEKNPGARRAGTVALAGCLAAVAVVAVLNGRRVNPVPLETKYGTLRVSQRVAENYRAALAFLQEKKEHGEAVLILPEDTTLYFLSDTHTPTRVYPFTPGVVAPGKMTEELFREIEEKNVKYLLWSNRTFGEYGVSNFGRDFNQELAHYLAARFERKGPLVPGGEKHWGLTFVVWERTGAEGTR
jgi:hypothetical protein